MTTGTEQAEKTLKSVELQSRSQQQLTSHCAGDKSQTHKAATAETRRAGVRTQVAGSGCHYHCKVSWIHPTQKVHFVGYWALGEVGQVEIHHFEPSIWTQSLPKRLTWLPQKVLSVLKLHKDSDFIIWIWKLDTWSFQKLRGDGENWGRFMNSTPHLPDLKKHHLLTPKPLEVPSEHRLGGRFSVLSHSS